MRHPGMRTIVHLAALSPLPRAPPGSRWRTREAVGTLVLPPQPGSPGVLPLRRTIDLWKAGWPNDIRTIVQSPQHGGPQNVVVSSNAVDGENRQTGAGIGGCPKHVPDAVGAGPGGQGVLEWCALGFKCLHELFRECPGHQTLHCAPNRDSSESAVRFRQCSQPRTRQCRPHLLWNFALREPVAYGHQHLWRRCRPREVSGVRKCTLLVPRKNREVRSANCRRCPAVQLHWRLRLKLKSFWWQLSALDLRSPGLQLTERFFGPRCHTCPRQAVGHVTLPDSHFLASRPYSLLWGAPMPLGVRLRAASPIAVVCNVLNDLL